MYVLPVDSQAAGNALENAVRQQLTEGIAVVLASTNRRDGRGAAGLAEIDMRREAVRAALLGWAPSAEATPLTYRRGRLLTLTDRTIWWQDEFETQHLVSEAA